MIAENVPTSPRSDRRRSGSGYRFFSSCRDPFQGGTLDAAKEVLVNARKCMDSSELDFRAARRLLVALGVTLPSDFRSYELACQSSKTTYELEDRRLRRGCPGNASNTYPSRHVSRPTAKVKRHLNSADTYKRLVDMLGPSHPETLVAMTTLLTASVTSDRNKRPLSCGSRYWTQHCRPGE